MSEHGGNGEPDAQEGTDTLEAADGRTFRLTPEPDAEEAGPAEERAEAASGRRHRGPLAALLPVGLTVVLGVVGLVQGGLGGWLLAGGAGLVGAPVAAVAARRARRRQAGGPDGFGAAGQRGRQGLLGRLRAGRTPGAGRVAGSRAAGGGRAGVGGSRLGKLGRLLGGRSGRGPGRGQGRGQGRRNAAGAAGGPVGRGGRSGLLGRLGRRGPGARSGARSAGRSGSRSGGAGVGPGRGSRRGPAVGPRGGAGTGRRRGPLGRLLDRVRGGGRTGGRGGGGRAGGAGVGRGRGAGGGAGVGSRRNRRRGNGGHGPVGDPVGGPGAAGSSAGGRAGRRARGGPWVRAASAISRTVRAAAAGARGTANPFKAGWQARRTHVAGRHQHRYTPLRSFFGGLFAGLGAGLLAGAKLTGRGVRGTMWGLSWPARKAWRRHQVKTGKVPTATTGTTAGTGGGAGVAGGVGPLGSKAPANAPQPRRSWRQRARRAAHTGAGFLGFGVGTTGRWGWRGARATGRGLLAAGRATGHGVARTVTTVTHSTATRIHTRVERRQKTSGGGWFLLAVGWLAGRLSGRRAAEENKPDTDQQTARPRPNGPAVPGPAAAAMFRPSNPSIPGGSMHTQHPAVANAVEALNQVAAISFESLTEIRAFVHAAPEMLTAMVTALSGISTQMAESPAYPLADTFGQAAGSLAGVGNELEQAGPQLEAFNAEDFNRFDNARPGEPLADYTRNVG